MIYLSEQPLDPRALEAQVEDPGTGALVTFVGRVRNLHHGRGVDHLVYEAYEPMAVARIEEIAAEVKNRLGVTQVAVAHRVGRLEIGDAAVVVVVAAAHRGEAFEACREIMDRIKLDVPIWKHETWSDGTSEWVGPESGGGL